MNAVHTTEAQVLSDATNAVKAVSKQFSADVWGYFVNTVRLALLDAAVLQVFCTKDEATALSPERLADTRNTAVELAEAKGMLRG